MVLGKFPSIMCVLVILLWRRGKGLEGSILAKHELLMFFYKLKKFLTYILI